MYSPCFTDSILTHTPRVAPYRTQPYHRAHLVSLAHSSRSRTHTHNTRHAHLTSRKSYLVSYRRLRTVRRQLSLQGLCHGQPGLQPSSPITPAPTGHDLCARLIRSRSVHECHACGACASDGAPRRPSAGSLERKSRRGGTMRWRCASPCQRRSGTRRKTL